MPLQAPFPLPPFPNTKHSWQPCRRAPSILPIKKRRAGPEASATAVATAVATAITATASRALYLLLHRASLQMPAKIRLKQRRRLDLKRRAPRDKRSAGCHR